MRQLNQRSTYRLGRSASILRVNGVQYGAVNQKVPSELGQWECLTLSAQARHGTNDARVWLALGAVPGGA
jgi:hypothetical protein